MKVLIATDKPFAKVAVDGIRKEIEAAGYELALLEKYTENSGTELQCGSRTCFRSVGICCPQFL